jgi:hypothetical protein
MEPKEMIIKKLQLREDFFIRNPGTCKYDKREQKLIIAFREWKLLMTEDEYQKLERFLQWACGACCGFGGYTTYPEGEFVAIEGIPCGCHVLSWGWAAVIPWQ